MVGSTSRRVTNCAKPKVKFTPFADAGNAMICINKSVALT
jgi:hypothetical protein